MSYVYSKRGSSFGQSDEDGGAQADPLTALQSVRSVYPSIVSGAAPTHSSTLSQEDVPTYMPSRTLTQSPSVAVEVGAAALQQALYQPPTVDKGYQDASLFSDVPIRPTLSVSENPAAMPSVSVKTMQQAYASEVMPSQLTTAYVNTGMSPLTVVGAPSSGQGAPPSGQCLPGWYKNPMSGDCVNPCAGFTGTMWDPNKGGCVGPEQYCYEGRDGYGNPCAAGPPPTTPAMAKQWMECTQKGLDYDPYKNQCVKPLQPLPPIISASTYLSPSAQERDMMPEETLPAPPLSKTADSLFDALHPNAVYVEPDPATAIYPVQAPTGSTVPTSDDPGAKVSYETDDMWGAAGAQAGAAAAGGGYLPSTIEQQAAAQQSAAGQGSSVIPLVAGAALLAYLLLGR